MSRIRTTRRIVSAFSLLCFLDVCMVMSKTQATEGVVVSFRVESSQFPLHTPAVVEFVVKNSSEQPVKLSLGKNDKQNFMVAVTRPNGTRDRFSQPLREGIGTTGERWVAGSKEYRQRLVLDEWFDFGVEGKYEVEVRLTQPVKSADGTAVTEVAPFHTSLEILPRDPARLNETCALLVRRVYAAPSYEAAAQAALELGYVRDPIAVPYLESAMNSGRMVEGIAISGLRRIGNEQAVRVLIKALSADSPGTQTRLREQAGAALGLIAFETRDATLKEVIQQALRRMNAKQP